MRRYALIGCSALVLVNGVFACTSTLNNTHDQDQASNSTGGGSGGSESSTDSKAGSEASTDSNAQSGGDSGGTTNKSTEGESGAAGAPSDDSGGAGGSGATGGTASSGATSRTAGSGGSGGSGTQGPSVSDSCEGSDVEPNEDRDSATPYELGWEFQGCLQSKEDVDWYEFITPDDDRGGVVTVRVTDVGPNGDTDLAVWSARDNGQFHSVGTSSDGASVFFFFNAEPASTFRLEVTNYRDLTEPNPYLLTISYTEVPDVHEPNDTRPEASPIEVGEAVEGYSFAGWQNSTEVATEQWYDWYKIDLEAGPTSFLMDIVASDVDGEIVLYDPIGTEIADEGTSTDGSSVLLEYDIAEAGTYFLRLSPYRAPGTKGNTTDPPEYAVTPYTLTVTQ